ncbi:MAG: DUF4424 family protein [Magnetococcales bacterium]|nr:DUF4424 family protein [Magnetococcales bacterium]
MGSLLWVGNLQANDGVGAVGVGGVVVAGKSDQVRMRKEVLEISLNRIKVSYEFINLAAEAITLPVFFPLPAYDSISEYLIPRGSPTSFKVLINGKMESYSTSFRAFACTSPDNPFPPCGKEARRDVTDQLKKIGLTDEQIVYFPKPFSPFGGPFGIQGGDLTNDQRERLLKWGLYDNTAHEKDFHQLLWEVEVAYSWQVTFPARGVVKVEHEYDTFPSRAGATYRDADELRDVFCAGPSLIKIYQELLKKRETEGDLLADLAPHVEYILTTANTWAGPIEEFTLILRKATPDEKISLCFPGNVEKVDPVTLKIELKNFVPEQNLKVMFLNGQIHGELNRSSPPVLSQGNGIP